MEAVENSFRRNLEQNSKIKELQEVLASGKLVGDEADRYALEVGQALAKAFAENVTSDALPDGKMFYNIASRVIPPPLQSTHEEVSSFAQAMYQGMNERAKMGMKAQRSKYNTDREKGIVEHACSGETYEDVQKTVESSLVGFAQSVATETMKANAEFQYQAGLSPVIRRSANGGCCAWCAKLAGAYPYEDVRATGSDVYRRHRDCRCKVFFDPGDGKVQNVHTKRWEKKPLEAPVAGDNIGSTIKSNSKAERIRLHERMRLNDEARRARQKRVREYLDNANPGVGKVVKEPGWNEDKKHKNDERIAEWLKQRFGGTYTLLAERREKGLETADCRRGDGIYVEFKSPTSVNAVGKRIKKGTSQIASMGNPEKGIIVLDITGRKTSQAEMLTAIEREGTLRSKQKILDIIVKEGEDVIDVIRIKK